VHLSGTGGVPPAPSAKRSEAECSARSLTSPENCKETWTFRTFRASTYWDRGRPGRPERETERSGVQRSQPHLTGELQRSLDPPNFQSNALTGTAGVPAAPSAKRSAAESARSLTAPRNCKETWTFRTFRATHLLGPRASRPSAKRSAAESSARSLTAPRNCKETWTFRTFRQHHREVQVFLSFSVT